MNGKSSLKGRRSHHVPIAITALPNHPAPRLTNVHKQKKRTHLSLEVLEDRLVPGGYEVVNLGDAGLGMGNTGDLRYCINLADGQQGASTITFQAGLQGTIVLNGALPKLFKNITITAQGAGAIAIEGKGMKIPFTIFNVVPTTTCEIDYLTIQDGYANGGNGGGIFNGGTLTLKNDDFYFDDAAAANNMGGNGGAIFNGTGATLNVSYSYFANNSAGGYGGAIENSGNLTLTGASIFANNAKDGAGLASLSDATTKITGGTQIYSNNATGRGGGIFETGGKMTISGVSGGYVKGNEAFNGGGIYVSSGSLTITNRFSIYQNQATGGGNGGGLFIYEGKVSMSGGTIDYNSSTNGSGGGIYNLGGTLTLDGAVTIGPSNSAGGNGGGVYCAIGSTTTFNVVTVSDNKLTGKNSKGVGVYWQDNGVQKAVLNTPALTDKDDPGGVPVHGA